METSKTEPITVVQDDSVNSVDRVALDTGNPTVDLAANVDSAYPSTSNMDNKPPTLASTFNHNSTSAPEPSSIITEQSSITTENVDSVDTVNHETFGNTTSTVDILSPVVNIASKPADIVPISAAWW